MATPPPPLTWSSTFRLTAPSPTQSLHLTGDKIILPHSVLQDLLHAADRAQDAARTSASWGYNVSTTPADGQKLPHPLMFQLMNPQNGKTVFAGIREFSAAEGEVGLSKYLLNALGVNNALDNPVDLTQHDDSDQHSNGGSIQRKHTRRPPAFDFLEISVTAQQAPKGSFVRLRPLEAGYESEDWKALLEQQLRGRYTTLTKHTVLSFQSGSAQYSFLIDNFKPQAAEAVCVVDTDLEVDIQPLDEAQAEETAKILKERGATVAGASSEGGEIDIWKAVEGLVAPGCYVDYELPTWDRTRPLQITVSGLQEDIAVDLLVTPRSSRHRTLPRKDDYVFGDFDAPEDGNKTIIIQPCNVDMAGTESLLISIHGYSGPGVSWSSTSFSLRAQILLQDSPFSSSSSSSFSSFSSSSSTPVSKSVNPEEDAQCQNCHSRIPKRTIALHENFCHRNNIPCPTCHKVFQRSSSSGASAHWHCLHDSSCGDSTASKAKHDAIVHTPQSCPSCDAPEFPCLLLLARHRASVCPGKIILCQFCHLEVPQDGDPEKPLAEQILSGLSAHELADGGRTTECHLCDRIVRLRDMTTHLKSHDMDKAARSAPKICRNARCGRTRFGVGAKGVVRYAAGPGVMDRLGLCASCFEPLYANVHDPQGKAMRRRVERRYLSQLIGGCGKGWCVNEWCKTGRKNLGLEAKGGKTSEALPMVQPMLGEIWEKGKPMFFCVEEMNQKRRGVAELVAGENVYDLEWCVAAAEAEDWDIGRMRNWLESWAPKRV